MTRKRDAQEPLLNAVARKLGQAAGTLANMTHMLTTDQTTKKSHSPSKSQSVNPGSADKENSPVTAGQNRTTKQRPAKPQKRTRTSKSRTGSRRSTTGSKRASRKKGSGRA